MPDLVTVRSTSTTASFSACGSGDGPADRPPSANNRARSLVDRCERRLFNRTPPTSRWITFTSAQNVIT